MKKLSAIICFSVLLAASANAAEPKASNAQESPAISIRGGKCPHGLHPQPNGPFAAMVFCEDALGAYVAVVYNDPMTIPRFERWSLDDRMWQERNWTSDADSFAWSPKGESLFIATGDVYGSGALYQLELKQRKVVQLLPRENAVSVDNPGPGYSLISISKDGRSLSYQLHSQEESNPPVTQQLTID